MTHVTNNVLARLNIDIERFLAKNSPKPTPKNSPDQLPRKIPNNILSHIHNQSHATPSNQFSLTYGFWRTLLTAIREQKLSLELLTDKPSELPNNQIWLNHERVTALLDEQGLPYSDLSPILFHIVMAATNNLYPGALISEGSIESEHSLISNDGAWSGKHRYCFCISVDKLPISKHNISSILDAELG